MVFRDVLYTYKINVLHCFIFADINECEQQHGCSHICNNNIGSYRCSCEDGFKLDTINDRADCIREFYHTNILEIHAYACSLHWLRYFFYSQWAIMLCLEEAIARIAQYVQDKLWCRHQGRRELCLHVKCFTKKMFFLFRLTHSSLLLVTTWLIRQQQSAIFASAIVFVALYNAVRLDILFDIRCKRNYSLPLKVNCRYEQSCSDYVLYNFFFKYCFDQYYCLIMVRSFNHFIGNHFLPSVWLVLAFVW